MKRALPSRLNYFLLCLVVLLASCSSPANQSGGAPTPAPAQPTPAPAPTAAPRATAAPPPTSAPPPTAAPAPTGAPAATQPSARATATAIPADTFVVPAKQSEALPPQALTGAIFSNPNIEREIRAFF